MMLSNCGSNGNCGFTGPPPPDTILSMPPPPLPSFLLPKTAVLALPANESHPCFTTLMCDPSPNPRESGIEFVELSGDNVSGMENTWLFVLISSGVGVLILGGLLAIILLKCRDCNFSYHDSNIKQSAMTALGEPSKANPFMAGGILYPCAAAPASTHSRDTLQSQLANDSRLLWATLTPHGTRHFISDYNGTDSGHYEVVDYRLKAQSNAVGCGVSAGGGGGGGNGGGGGSGSNGSACGSGGSAGGMGGGAIYREHVKRTPIKSFDNNGFIDYDYEDPTPLMDSYHDDLDSGYQEPQEVIGTMQRASPRPLVSSPTRIDNPNIPPLNYYPSSNRSINNGIGMGMGIGNGGQTLQSNYAASTMNRKATLSRRISDASTSYGGPNM